MTKQVCYEELFICLFLQDHQTTPVCSVFREYYRTQKLFTTFRHHLCSFFSFLVVKRSSNIYRWKGRERGFSREGRRMRRERVPYLVWSLLLAHSAPLFGRPLNAISTLLDNSRHKDWLLAHQIWVKRLVWGPSTLLVLVDRNPRGFVESRPWFDQCWVLVCINHCRFHNMTGPNWYTLAFIIGFLLLLCNKNVMFKNQVETILYFDNTF